MIIRNRTTKTLETSPLNNRGVCSAPGTMAKPTPHSLSVGISVKTGAAHAGRPDSIWRVCAMTGTSAFSCLYTTEALP